MTILFAGWASSHARAMESLRDEARAVEAVRTSEAITIDGVLDESAWDDAERITDFFQVSPNEFAQPTETTEVRVLLDDQFLYVAARLDHKDPNDITAIQLAPASRIFGDDTFIVLLDPFGDRRNGYRFEVNPNGVIGDALIENNNRLLSNWDGIWQANSVIDEGGWTTEMRIPLATISFNPQLDRWGINFQRDYEKGNELIVWSAPAGRVEFQSAPSYFGELTGMAGLEEGLGLDITPSFSLTEDRDFETGESDTGFEPSLDVAYRVTPALTARLTLNTDFSATEADDRQINLTRFGLFFPEKREFFLQDENIFEFANLDVNGRPFFSRTIGLTADGEPLNLEHGGKLTGRHGRWNIGVLAAQQESTEDLDRRDVFVARIAANVFSESSVGFILTDGDPQNDREARTAGVDYRWRTTSLLPENRALEGEVWYQQTDNEGSVGEDSAFGARVSLPGDRHNAQAYWYRFDEFFDPAMGFVNRNGIDEYFARYRFRHRPADGIWQRHDIAFEARYTDSIIDTERSEFYEFMPWTGELRSGDRFTFFLRREGERLEEGFDLFGILPIAPGDYDWNRLAFSFGSANFRVWEFDAGFSTGDFYDGTRLTLTGEVEWKPSKHFNAELGYTSNDVDLPSGSFTARLITFEATAAINRNWSFNALMQFDNISEGLGIDLRARWHIDRGRDFWFVWARNLQRDEFDDFNSRRQDTVLKGVWTFRF